MKTTFLAVIAATLLSISASAQVNFGAKAGLNLFKVSADGDDNSDLKAGLHIGLLGHIHMSDRFALQPELYYSEQGAKSEVDGDERKLNLGYINVPLMFQYMFDNGFRLQAGPQIGFLTRARSKNGGNTSDVKSSYNSLDFGIPLGVGYISPSGFGVDARYQIGLSNIHEADGNKAYNRGFQVGVFYQFDHD